MPRLSWHGRPAPVFSSQTKTHGRGAHASMARTLVLLSLIGVQLAFVLGVAPAGDAAAPATRPASPFRYVDVFIDTQGQSLAAYQFELRAPKGVQLVGIEGGEHEAFAQPPYYDPKALAEGERIVIAAFDTGADLPAGKTRVARLSVRVGADAGGPQAKPDYQVTLQVAASSDAKPIEGGTISVTEGVAQ